MSTSFSVGHLEVIIPIISVPLMSFKVRTHLTLGRIQRLIRHQVRIKGNWKMSRTHQFINIFCLSNSRYLCILWFLSFYYKSYEDELQQLSIDFANLVTKYFTLYFIEFFNRYISRCMQVFGFSNR